MRGPDKLWGGDIKNFHPPTGIFEGIIGGPPCQDFSPLKYVNKNAIGKWGNLIPEFERVVTEVKPERNPPMVDNSAKMTGEEIKNLVAVIEHVMAVGHGEVVIKVADGKIVFQHHEAQWELRHGEKKG